MIFEKLIQLYAAVCEVCMQTLSILILSSSTCPFSSFYFQFSVQIPKTASIDNMFLVFFFYLSFFWPAKLGGLRACRLTPPHLIRLLVIVLSNKRLYPLKTVHCFERDVLLNCPACWTCMVVFFLCLKMSFLSDDSSMAFILHLWPPHFFGTATKKWQDFPPLDIYTSAFQLCWSAPPSAVIWLQWMRYALMEVDRRGSWCEGERKVFTIKEITSPFPGSLVCCLKPILLFNDIPLCICLHLNFLKCNLSIKFYNLSCKR